MRDSSVIHRLLGYGGSIGRGPRHGDTWPSGLGLTVALPFLQRVSSVPRVTWGGCLRLPSASQQRKGGWKGGSRRRSFTGSGALRGRGRKLLILLVLVVLFLYLVLPLVLESLIASSVQTALEGTTFERPTKPDVEVSSTYFPPKMLLGRIDRVEVTIDQNSRA